MRLVCHQYSPILGGYASHQCQVSPEVQANTASTKADDVTTVAVLRRHAMESEASPSGRGTASVTRPVGAVGVDVERTCRALDDFPGDDNLLHALETRQIEHRVEQYALHDRTQPPRAGLALDCL